MTHNSQITFDLEAPTLAIPDWLRFGFHCNDDLGIAHMQIGPLNFVVDAGLDGKPSFREAVAGALGLDRLAAWLTAEPEDDDEACPGLFDAMHCHAVDEPVAEAIERSVMNEW